MTESLDRFARSLNIGGLLSDNGAANPGQLLNNAKARRSLAAMTRFILSLAFCGLAGAAQAACYADYKAKQDNPLRLHYGVAEVRGACTAANARTQIRPRIAVDGWELLNIVSVFSGGGLAERRESAGRFFLRY